MTIRPEQPGDEAAIHALQRAAFGTSTLEAEIVDKLRAAGDLVISLVATDDDAIVGHVALSNAHVEEHEALGLGPIGGRPGAAGPGHRRGADGSGDRRSARRRTTR